MRIGWGGLGLLAALLLTLAPAFGQPAKPASGKRPPPAEIVSIDMGWHPNLLARDRWQPVTVWITSRERSFSGILTVEFPQDHTQKAKVVVGPVSTTPGMVTPIELEIAPYRDAQKIVVELTNGTFSTKAEYYKDAASDQLALPRVAVSQCGLMVFVGRTSASKAVDVRTTSSLDGAAALHPNADEFNEADVWEQMIPALRAPDRLPFSWMAYESADVLVCNATDIADIEPRAQAALSKWVESGGRLVVKVDPVGAAWPSFLSTGPGGPPAFGESQQVVVPAEELKAMLPRVVLSNFQARLLTLTDEGKARGWTTMFEAAKPEQTSSGALVAYGPHGLGMVTLISFDPANIAALIDDEAIKAVWRRTIQPILPPHALLGGFQQVQQFGWEPGDVEVIGATNAALDRIAIVPPISSGVFWLIAAFMLMLALAIGPFDAKFLKRRRLSQHSWLTAIAWIAAASLGAVLAPRLMRDGQTVVGRTTVVDTICDSQGSALQTAKQGLTGIFAGRPVQLALEGARPGAWLRGVSALQHFYDQGHLTGMPDLTLIPSTEEADAPVRGAWADTVSVPQWSFRTLADATPMQPAQSSEIGARIRDNDRNWEVTLTNVPSSASVSELVIRIGNQWLTDVGQGITSDNGRNRVYSVDKKGSSIPVSQLVREQPKLPAVVHQIGERSLVSLPWVRERAQAIDAMTGSGQYACVYATLSGLQSDLKAVGVSNVREQASSLVRLLTPLPLEDKK